MSQQALGNGSDELAQLGEAKLVCRTSRKTLFWLVALAVLSCAVGLGVLSVVVVMFLTAGFQDISGSVVLQALGAVSLWGAAALWGKVNRLRLVQVVVHVGGLSHRDENNRVLTCRWDQIADVRWRLAHFYQETSLTIQGVIPIPGTKTQTFSHNIHRIRVLRKDGVELVFTDELQNIFELGQAIHQEASRNSG